MGYCIIYQPEKSHAGQWFGKIRIVLLTGFCLFLFVSVVRIFWAEGYSVLQKLFPGPGESVAVSALNHFAYGLLDGKSMGTALVEFCRNLLA